MPLTSTSNPPRANPCRAVRTAPTADPPAPPRAKPRPRTARIRAVLKIALGTVLAASCLSYGLLFALHLEPLVMLTGSMGNTISTGSLVIDQQTPPHTLKVGDIISFQKPLGQPGLDTHRIIAITHSNGYIAYQTKGDANPRRDPWTISFQPGMTAHRVVYSIPHLGWIPLYLRTPLIRTLILVAILLTLFSTLLKTLAAHATPKPTPTARNQDTHMDSTPA